jgi:hypothetical protein
MASSKSILLNEYVKVFAGKRAWACNKRRQIMAKVCTPQERQRFLQLMFRIIGNKTRQWGYFLDRPEPTVRNWRDGGGVPHDADDILRSMAIDPASLRLPDEAWAKFLAALPEDAEPPSQKHHGGPLFTAADLIAIAQSIGPGSTVIIIARSSQIG